MIPIARAGTKLRARMHHGTRRLVHPYVALPLVILPIAAAFFVPATPVLGQSAGFTDVTGPAKLGGYRASSGDTHGPGGVFTDLDRDGFPELVLAGAGNASITVFHNRRPGAGSTATAARIFVPLSAAQMPSNSGTGVTGVVAGDYDNDGDLDLYVLRHPGFDLLENLPADTPNELWRNRLVEDGELAFELVPPSSTSPPIQTNPQFSDRQLGLSTAEHWGRRLDLSLSAAWADVDRDGDLDLYVGNHDTSNNTLRPFLDPPGERDILYLNQGDGTFVDFTLEAGTTGYESAEAPSSNGRSCAGDGANLQCFAASNAVLFADIDNDRWPDLVVTNKMNNPLYGADMLYHNRGVDSTGRWLGFENITHSIADDFGVAPDPSEGTPNAMGIDAGDFDNDGDLDLYITDADCDRALAGLPFGCIGGARNNLLVNQLIPSSGISRPRTFTDETMQRGVPGDFSWGTQWLDFDNDGFLDLHVVTAARHPIYAPEIDDFLYRGTGSSFLDQANGSGVAQQADSRGDLAADYDRDGAIDLFVVNVGPASDQRSALYENELVAGSSGTAFLNLSLRSHPSLPPAGCGSGAALCRSNRDAIGARVTVRANVDGLAGDELQIREVRSGNGNAASTASLDLEFGLGAADPDQPARVTVAWPSGRTSVHDLPINRNLTLGEPAFPAATVIGESGTKIINHGLSTVNLSRTYTHPVAFALVPSFNGGDPSLVRLEGITGNSFQLSIQEAPNTLDPSHAFETVSWMVLEAGSWRLADGTRLEVGTVSTLAAARSGKWQPVSLAQPLSDKSLMPVVLTQVQTRNDPTAWVKTRQRNATASGFEVGLEAEEAYAGSYSAETVGYLAMEPSRGLWSGRAYAAATSRAVVGGNFTHLDLGQDLDPAAPRLLAALASYNGGDPAALRLRNLGSSQVEIKLEEDTTADLETGHVGERVSFLALEGNGQLHGEAFVSDPPPIADFTSSCTALRCTFTSTSSDGGQTLPGYAYTWVFGDGDAGNGKSLSHTFERPGSYEVLLTVKDRAGQSVSKVRTVSVTGPLLEMVAEYLPPSAAPPSVLQRTTFRTTSDDPPFFDYVFDPNLGTFEERPGGRCQVAGRVENPTYLKLQVASTQTITACETEFSWSQNPTSCDAATLALINSGNFFTINTNDVETNPASCAPDLSAPLTPFNQVDWMFFRATIGGVVYERMLRFRQRAEVVRATADADTYVSSMPPNPAAGPLGQSTELRVQKDAPAIKFAFLRFDEIPEALDAPLTTPRPMPSTLSSARVRLNVLAGTSLNVRVHPCGDGAWGEDELTWSNWSSKTGQPCPGDPPAGAFDMPGGWETGRSQPIDVLSLVNSGQCCDLALQTLESSPLAGAQPDLRLGSAESADQPPYLTLTYVHP